MSRIYFWRKYNKNMCKLMSDWFLIFTTKKSMCQVLSNRIFCIQCYIILFWLVSRRLLRRSIDKVMCSYLPSQSASLRWQLLEAMCKNLSGQQLCWQKISLMCLSLPWCQCYLKRSSNLCGRLHKCLCWGVRSTVLCLFTLEKMCDNMPQSLL